MIPFCLILGDSTGVGTAGALARDGIRCEIHAHVGARSSGVLEEWQGRITPAVALIALGSNDVGDPRLERQLTALRARTRAPSVTWLAPYNRTAASIVTRVALRFGDKVIPLAQCEKPREMRLMATSRDGLLVCVKFTMLKLLNQQDFPQALGQKFFFSP